MRRYVDCRVCFMLLMTVLWVWECDIGKRMVLFEFEQLNLVFYQYFTALTVYLAFWASEIGQTAGLARVFQDLEMIFTRLLWRNRFESCEVVELTIYSSSDLCVTVSSVAGANNPDHVENHAVSQLKSINIEHLMLDYCYFCIVIQTYLEILELFVSLVDVLINLCCRRTETLDPNDSDQFIAWIMM